jgi:acylphosphatase
MRRVKIVVAGRVQGVYFRYFTQNKAQELGIVGSVRNLDSGHVEIIAEADNTSLEQFIRWCHKGPVTARVDAVDINEIEQDEPLSEFVRR